MKNAKDQETNHLYPREADYTRLYFVANKLRAVSFLVETSFMKEAVVPEDEEQVRIGLGLLFHDLSKEIDLIGQELEFKEPLPSKEHRPPCFN